MPLLTLQYQDPTNWSCGSQQRPGQPSCRASSKCAVVPDVKGHWTEFPGLRALFQPAPGSQTVWGGTWRRGPEGCRGQWTGGGWTGLPTSLDFRCEHVTGRLMSGICCDQEGPGHPRPRKCLAGWSPAGLCFARIKVGTGR